MRYRPRPRRAHRLEIALCAAALFALAGCPDDDTGIGVPDADPAEEDGEDARDPDAGIPGDEASIRFFHAAPDAPAIDLYAEGQSAPLIADLDYGSASHDLDVGADTYAFEIRAAGDSPDADPLYVAEDVAVAAGDRITAVAAGLLGGEEDDGFRVLPIAEDFAAPDDDTARVRAVHAGADAPPLELAAEAEEELGVLDRFADSSPEGAAWRAGEELAIAARAGDPPETLTSFTAPALAAEAELLIIAAGLVEAHPREEAGLTLFILDATGEVSAIRQDPILAGVHASPDAPPLDVYEGDAQKAESLDFGELSEAFRVPPGSYELDFYEIGTDPENDESLATLETGDLEAGERYLAAVSGYLYRDEEIDEPLQLFTWTDDVATGETETAYAAVAHASPDAPAVDVGAVENDSLAELYAEGLGFGERSEPGGFELPTSASSLGVAEAGETDPLASFDVQAQPGSRAIGILAGGLTPKNHEEALRLLWVDTTELPWQADAIAPE